MPDEIIATIGLEVPLGRLDGAGSGYGLAQCPSCARWIDTSCSQCGGGDPAPMSPEDVLSRREELRAQQRRERSWYERGKR